MIDRIVVWALSLKAKLSSERGQDMLEYAIIGGGIAIVIAAGIALLVNGGYINNFFTAVGECIDFSGGDCPIT